MEPSAGTTSAAAAPPFLAPPEIMATLEIKDPTISSSPRAVEESLADEFLGMLKRAMPPGGIGGAPTPSYTTPTGELMGRTENQSATYLSSSSACLDFFFQVVPSTPEVTVVELLERAWGEDSLTALKLIFHLRGVRGTGKSDREGFYHAALWLHEKHPFTLRRNLAMVAEFGYFKDILEVLLRLLEGPEVRRLRSEAKAQHENIMRIGKTHAKVWNSVQKAKKARQELRKRNASGKGEKQGEEEAENPELHNVMSDDDDAPDGFVFVGQRPRVQRRSGYYAKKGARAREAKEAGTLKPREERVAASLEEDRAAKETAASSRKQKRLNFAKRVAQLFYEDAKFQALYLQTAKLFANQLKEDLKALQENRLLAISLASKWTPSVDSSYDLRTLLCYAISTQIFPKEAFPEYERVGNWGYGLIVRERFRKEVLVPLRKVLELPEVYMSASRWGDVNYRRVASVAMSNYKTHFLEHDGERFKKFLDDVKSGKEKVAAGALLPHEIVKSAVNDSDDSAEVAELQWKRMVEDMKKVGSLSDCIAVCDVSGSMSGVPMEVCIALGMLLSDLSQEPWKGHVITFSENPEIHLVSGETLKERHAFTATMDWGMNTNLQLVFDKLLTMAQLNKLEKEKMVKRLFIFSDMEFDVASNSDSPWETDYHVICNKFRDAGYGSPPQIVFWNLRNTTSTPVVKSQQGVALVSGFSKNMLKLFLQNGGTIDPMTVMNAAIEDKEYGLLSVVD